MPTTSSGMTRAEVIALQAEYGSTRALVKSFGIPEGNRKEYLAARRAVERIITSKGKEQHARLSPKWSKKAKLSEKLMDAKKRGQPPRSIRTKMRVKVDTDPRRKPEGRGAAGMPGRWVTMRGLPTMEDLDALLTDPVEFWQEEFGDVDFAEFDMEDVAFEWGED